MFGRKQKVTTNQLWGQSDFGGGAWASFITSVNQFNIHIFGSQLESKNAFTRTSMLIFSGIDLLKSSLSFSPTPSHSHHRVCLFFWCLFESKRERNFVHFTRIFVQKMFDSRMKVVCL